VLLEPARVLDNRVLDKIEQLGAVDTILLAHVVTR
jgi:hypothetical protein